MKTIKSTETSAARSPSPKPAHRHKRQVDLHRKRLPIEYFNISMDGEALENMDFHRHLDEGAVTYYPKYPVLAPVTDGSGYGGYI